LKHDAKSILQMQPQWFHERDSKSSSLYNHCKAYSNQFSNNTFMYVTSFILMKLINSYVILELVKVPFASTAAQPFAFTSISQTNLYINMAHRFSKKKE